MKQLKEIAKRKIIGLLSEVDVENTTVQDIAVDLRNRGFKPPYGKYWTGKKLLEVLAVPGDPLVPEVTTKLCHMCRQQVGIDYRICPECWTKFEDKEKIDG